MEVNNGNKAINDEFITMESQHENVSNLINLHQDFKMMKNVA